MKRIFMLLLVAIFTSSLVNAQETSGWMEKTFVDEFGDDTGESYKALVAIGTFSNSATQDADLLGGLIWTPGKEMYIKVLEYGSSLANGIESTYELVKVKNKENGEVIEMKRVFFSKGGYLIFDKKHYEQIEPVLTTPGEYVMIFNRGGKYGRSKYKLNITH